MSKITAHRFVLRSLETDREIAYALVCPETTYACVRWLETDRLERRPGTHNLWNNLEREFAAGLPFGPVPQVSATTLLLAGARIMAVAADYVGAEVIETAAAPSVALDRHLIEPAAR
jgi:hypothetical protein